MSCKKQTRRIFKCPKCNVVLCVDLVKVKVKVKLSLCLFLTEYHAIKVYCGSGGITPHILDLGTEWS